MVWTPINIYLQHTVDTVTSIVVIPVERLTFHFDTGIDPISLMGNDAGAITGEESNNIIINFGTQITRIKIDGILTDLDQEAFPDGYNYRYFNPPAAGTSTLSGSNLSNRMAVATSKAGLPATITASNLRYTLAWFAANQTDEPDVKFIWPEFVTDVNKDGVAVSWSGSVRNFKCNQEAGNIEQYPYSLDFTVGATS